MMRPRTSARLRHAALALGVLACAAGPLANPLLLGIGLILGGVLVAAGPMCDGPDAGRDARGDVVFRHYL